MRFAEGELGGELVVGVAEDAQVLAGGGAAFGERVDVIELQKAASGAAMAFTLRVAALQAIAGDDFASDLLSDVRASGCRRSRSASTMPGTRCAAP